MRVISLICQKGGTAKTTTAINLAVAAQNAGHETVIIDLDPQVSACEWYDLRGGEKPPHVVPCPVAHLERTLKAAADNGAELAIIDTAGRSNDAATAAARAANAILVPMQPSLIDLKTLRSTLDVIAASGNTAPVRVVLSRVKATGTRHESSAEFLKHEQMGVCPIMLGERVTYQDAFAAGLGVTEAEPSGKAAQEITALWEYVRNLSGFLESKQSNNLKNKARHEQTERPSKRSA